MNAKLTALDTYLARTITMAASGRTPDSATEQPQPGQRQVRSGLIDDTTIHALNDQEAKP